MGTVLVADRDLESVEALMRAAARAGLAIQVAENGIEALERFHAEGPRIVFVDRLLPVLDGLHVCQKIRASAAGSATAVILTGVPLEDDPERLRRSSRFTDYLAKPFRAEDAYRAMLPFLSRPDEAVAPARLPAGEAGAATGEPLARLLTDLVGRRQTGELVWSDGALVKALFFRDGLLVGGRSNGRLDLWPIWVMRDPLLLPAERPPLADCGSPDPSAEGPASPLERGTGATGGADPASRARWSVSLLLDLLEARAGSVRFVELPHPPETGLPVDVRGVVFRGLRRLPGETFEPLLPSLSCRLARAVTDLRPEELALTQVEQELLGLLDGRSLGELLALGRLTQHDLRPFLYGCFALGLAAPLSSPAPASPREPSRVADEIGSSGIASSGRLEEISPLLVMAAIRCASRTGILQLRRDGTQNALHFQDGEVIFARSNQPHHRLGQVLLKTGRISREDQRRALALQAVQTSRKLGAILIGIGALSLRELHVGLHDQIQRILTDSLAMGDGSYAFIEGQLPADDMVSLDPPTGQVLLEGARSCARVMARQSSSIPPGLTVLRRWSPTQVAGFEGWSPAETRVFEASEQVLRIGDLPGLPGLKPQEGPVAFLTLAALGCLTTGSEASLPSGEASPPPSDDAATLASLSGEVAQLRHLVPELESRIEGLERENRRLRLCLAAGERVAAG